MAKLEAEAMLLGIWRNIAELEDSISLDELQVILEAYRDEKYRQNKFLAALKGINLDEGSEEDARDKFERVKARAEAKMRGDNPEHAEYQAMGMDIEVE